MRRPGERTDGESIASSSSVSSLSLSLSLPLSLSVPSLLSLFAFLGVLVESSRGVERLV